MQQITNTHAAKVKSPVLSLAISWLIILGTYFLLRLIFIIFGFHLYAGLLGGCLAFVPYLISTIYLYKSTRTTNIWIYLLGIALPKQNNQTTTSNFPCNFNFAVSNMNRFNQGIYHG